MRADLRCKVLLLVIAVFVGMIALRPFFAAQPVHAQSQDVYPFFIEPGYVTLRAPDGSRQGTGKMVADLRNGDIWGFPTLTASPYPIDSTTSTPPTSRPMYLGKFDFTRTSAAAHAMTRDGNGNFCRS
jgi:hypothetical protein